ncbi:surfeit locus 1 family protein [Stylonychia lemnae]|uniref:SURF1-like protein n=1 Tax=Stylonychia lemnae TaxID=5949 RepID=A0A078AUC1_STYLE|nr:surfeit locus 1 family protein [Stylonychia lemnae]|eukprot:CDW84832.1 surfeit locus 1 family protein [Stylonychia lemnae]
MEELKTDYSDNRLLRPPVNNNQGGRHQGVTSEDLLDDRYEHQGSAEYVAQLTLTQSFILSENIGCIEDKVFKLTSSLNEYFSDNQPAKHVFMIFCGLLMDIMVLAQFYRFAMYGTTWRFPIALLMFYILRALMQFSLMICLRGHYMIDLVSGIVFAHYFWLLSERYSYLVDVKLFKIPFHKRFPMFTRSCPKCQHPMELWSDPHSNENYTEIERHHLLINSPQKNQKNVPYSIILKLNCNKNMSLKKIIFTSVTLPLAYQTFWAYNWQKGRKIEKIQQIKEREQKLVQPLVDFKLSDLPNEVIQSKTEFEKIWLYRPVRIKGIIDNEKEIYIQRPQSGEKGVEVVAPLYESVNDKGELQGIMVDRGWIKEQLKDLKIHWNSTENSEQIIEGVIMRGEGKCQTGKEDDEKNKIRIDLEEFVKNTEFGNKDVAKQIMIREVNFNENTTEQRTSLKRQTPADLCYWYVTPERHQAYSTFWLYATGLNLFANAVIWAYL